MRPQAGRSYVAPPVRRQSGAIRRCGRRLALLGTDTGSGLGAQAAAASGPRRRSRGGIARATPALRSAGSALADDLDRVQAELVGAQAGIARSSTRLRCPPIHGNVDAPPLIRRNPPVRRQLARLGAGTGSGLGSQAAAASGPRRRSRGAVARAALPPPIARDVSARSQRPREPQLPRRCAMATGKLLETLPFCSTGVCSLLLHIADARRESAADNLKAINING
jgi:hypothetical protein